MNTFIGHLLVVGTLLESMQFENKLTAVKTVKHFVYKRNLPGQGVYSVPRGTLVESCTGCYFWIPQGYDGLVYKTFRDVSGYTADEIEEACDSDDFSFEFLTLKKE